MTASASSRRRAAAPPLHAQVADALRAELDGGGLPAGAALPSEAALCRRFGVARSVVRQALATLLAEGRIRREPGRPATVAPPRVHRRLVQSSTGLFEQLAGSGVALRTRVLRLAAEAPPAAVADFFGTARTLVVERLRSVDGRPLAYVRTWLAEAGVPGLAAADLEDASLHRVLVGRYGLQPGNGRNRIRAVAADARLAEALQVPEGSPLLMLEGQGMDQHGRPLEWFTTWHRPEELAFDVDVTGAGVESLRPQLERPGPPGADAQAGARAGAGGAGAGDVRRPAAAPPSAPGEDDPLARAERLVASLAAELARLRAGTGGPGRA